MTTLHAFTYKQLKKEGKIYDYYIDLSQLEYLLKQFESRERKSNESFKVNVGFAGENLEGIKVYLSENKGEAFVTLETDADTMKNNHFLWLARQINIALESKGISWEIDIAYAQSIWKRIAHFNETVIRYPIAANIESTRKKGFKVYDPFIIRHLEGSLDFIVVLGQTNGQEYEDDLETLFTKLYDKIKVSSVTSLGCGIYKVFQTLIKKNLRNIIMSFQVIHLADIILF